MLRALLRSLLGNTAPLFLSVFLWHDFVSAESLSLKQIAASIPQRLIDHGIDRVGPLDLKRLVSDIHTRVRYAVFPVFTIGSGTGGTKRIGSSCHSEDQTVWVNEPHLRHLAHIEPIEGLLLHESLCALGWNDESYRISAPLGLLAEMSKQEIQAGDAIRSGASRLLAQPDFQRLFRQNAKTLDQGKKPSVSNGNSINPQKFMLAGTVTGGGRGGDGFGWLITKRILQHFFSIREACSRPPGPTKVPLTEGRNGTSDVLPLNINCDEVLSPSWWEYAFSLNLEVARFQFSSLPNFQPIEYPTAESFSVERNTSIDFDKTGKALAPLRITLDSSRSDFYKIPGSHQLATSIMLVLLVTDYPKFKVPERESSQVIEVVGSNQEKGAFQAFVNNLSAWKCAGLPPKNSSSQGVWREGVPLLEYMKKRIAVPREERNQPPHCFYPMP